MERKEHLVGRSSCSLILGIGKPLQPLRQKQFTRSQGSGVRVAVHERFKESAEARIDRVQL